MSIWKIFRQDGFLILFILNLSLLVSLTFNSTVFLQPQLGVKISVFPMSVPTALHEPTNLIPFLGVNPEIIPKIQEIEDINETFNAIYELINPHDALSSGNVTIAILDSGVNKVGWITNLVANYTTTSNSSQVYDDNGHGTLVGSIISKIAPNARLISIKVSDASGFAKTEWIEEGLKLALSYNNVSIIHASLGTTQLEALNYSLIANLGAKNITTVFAAGNKGPYATSLSSPAIFAETIAVGMVYNETHMPVSSSAGPRPSGTLGPDLVAPGVEIVGYDHNGEIVNRTGTSFAAPFVTGALALLKEKFPNASTTTLKAALLETAYFMNNTSPIRQGNGLLDISKAYELLKNIEASNWSVPLFTFAPKKLSSYFTYFGHAINGVNRTYRISLYSTIACNLTQINTNQTFPNDNTSRKFPINISVGILPRNITVGLNYIDISMKIPENLSMAKREGNITFQFSMGKDTYSSNLSIFIENRYPGGNILFYQGYDNDTFIPDGPTGSFSLLQQFLEGYYGMNTNGAIRSTGLINISGSLIATRNATGGITPQDLENRHILVLADIEFGISDQEITLIQQWVADGHSLLVLSYPSQIYNGTETPFSNQTAINRLLEPYGLNIEDDHTKNLSRFTWASTSVSDPIFEEKGWEFDYIGTSVKVSPEKGGKILATAINQKNSNEEEIPIAGYWVNSTSKGKIVVFGGMVPFNDLGVNLNRENLEVITRIFRWMIQDQQLSLDILLTSSPSVGGSTKIQITIINDPGFPEDRFNGTIMEANESFSQIMFKKSFNMYVGSWKPLVAGKALLWLNIQVSGKAPTNGVYVIEVFDTSSPDMFFLLIIGSFVLLGVAYFLLTSRRSRKLSPIEQRVALELHKRKGAPQHAGLQTFEKCPQCQATRYAKESKYCFRCGKEL